MSRLAFRMGAVHSTEGKGIFGEKRGGGSVMENQDPKQTDQWETLYHLPAQLLLHLCRPRIPLKEGKG